MAFQTSVTTSQIEKIKQEYTDKYVVVDGSRPELARFGDVVGQVRTVNMSGRALVEFQDFHLNTGWHDIDLDYLKVVDKPAPKEKKPAAKKQASKPAAKKPAGESAAKKLSPLEMARQQDAAGKSAAKKPAAKAKLSTADILAAARGGAAPKSKPAEAAPEPEPAAEAPAADAGDVAKVDRSSMDVAAMIAYCREHDAG